MLLAIAAFLWLYAPYESDAVFNVTQPQYGIRCLAFDPSQLNPTLALEIIDRRDKPTFDLFKKGFGKVGTHQDYADFLEGIHLNIISRSGEIHSAEVSDITNLLLTQEPSGHTSRMTIRFEKTGQITEGIEKYVLQFADFPPLELRPANPLVRLLPFLGGNLPAIFLAVGGGLIIFGAGFGLYDAKPIPDDFVPMPEPPPITSGEVWRARTNFRCLEELKQACVGTEDLIKTYHKEAIAAYRQLSAPKGYIGYKADRHTVESRQQRIANLLSGLDEQKAHIERVFAGDVRVDLQNYEDEISKLKREKEAEVDDLQRAERSLSDAGLTPDQRAGIRNNIESIRRRIKQFDLRLIELESRAKELREYDYAKLYKDLNVSPEAVRANYEHLGKIKDNVELINAITDKTKPAGNSEAAMSKEEQRLINKAKWEEKISRYKASKHAAIGKADDEEEKRRLENMYDDMIDKATQEWMKYQ